MPGEVPSLTDTGRVAESFFSSRYGVDQSVAADLLAVAMSKGGEHAELFFEHREGSNITFEQQAVKSASRSTTQGVGIRVIQGDAIGYAYTEDLGRDAMRRAADTAARIASRGDRAGPVDVMHFESASYYEPAASTVGVAPTEKVDLIRRADAAARALDASIARVDVNFIDELKHVMIVSSDGRIAGDVQPLVRFNVELPIRARRQPPDGALGRRRPHGHAILRRTPAGIAGPGGRTAGRPAAVGDRSAGRQLPGRAGGGRQRHPAPRGDRPRAGSGLQPQEDEQLHRPGRESRRLGVVHGRR